MKRFGLLLFTLSFLTGVSAQNRIELASVGLSMDVTDSWAVTSDKSQESDGQEVGIGYVTRFDSRTADLCTIVRFETVDNGEPDGWAFYTPPVGYTEVSTDVDLPVDLPFEQAVVDVYRQVRGNGDDPNFVSRYYVVRAIRDDYRYRITIGGLDRQFDRKQKEYQQMLASIRTKESL